MDGARQRTALLVGATGLVGGECLRRLLEAPDYARVSVLARRPVPAPDPRLDVRVVDFDRLDEHGVPQAEDVYCCLGTTIRVAGSQPAFRRVDQDYTVTVARLARQAGARRLALVSSVGANAASRVFYLRVKGETEREVAALGYECVEVFRPGGLIGRRVEQRRGDALSLALTRVVAPLMLDGLRPYRPVDAAAVAGAMVGALRLAEPGLHVRTFDDIQRLSGSWHA